MSAKKPTIATSDNGPVAWHEPGAYGNVTTHKDWALANGWEPLYATPTTSKPLTDEQIREFYNDNNNFELTKPYVIAFARSIEIAHGIKERT